MLSWTFVQDEVGALLIGRYNVDAEADNSDIRALHSINPFKIASFDLDSTLISTKSNTLHAIDHHDWKWWHPTIVGKLQALFSQGYIIIIFTNQGRLTTATGSEAQEMTTFKVKVEAISEDLGVPFTLYAACGNDGYRKPRIGMWDSMCADFGLPSGVQINESWANRQAGKQSQMDIFMVGDAAGRESDHSDCDVHFCENLGIPFFTPEEFFLSDKTQMVGHKFHPNWYLPVGLGKSAIIKPASNPLTESMEMRLIVLVGLPGSGKTTYYRRFLQPRGFERVVTNASVDSKEHFKAAKQYLLEGKSVVIGRTTWALLAERFGTRAQVLNFTTPADLCLHNDAVRALGGSLMNLENRGVFARIPFKKLQASFQKPESSEGFAEILEVDFEWVGGDEELKIWRKHWL